MEQFYLFCAIVGGTIFVGQFLLSLLGLAGDHEFGGDSGADHLDVGGHDGSGGAEHHGGDGTGHDSATWWFVTVLSFRTVVAGLAFFGLGGMAANASGAQPIGALAIALASGFAALYLVGWTMRGLTRLRSDGTVRIKNTLGQNAIVYLTIPGRRADKGKITVTVQGRTMEYEAETEHDELPTGATVRIVAVVGPETVEVVPVPEPARTSHA